jgi:hypothetical protein
VTPSPAVVTLYCLGFSGASDCCDAIDNYTFNCTYCESC